MRVTQVLAGSERLLNSEFEATNEWFFPEGRLLPGPKYPDTYFVWFKEGAEGLWWVFEHAKDRSLCPLRSGEIVHKFCLEHFPYQTTKGASIFFDVERPRIKQDELWKEGEAFAKVVSEVYASKTEDGRRVLLERHASTEESPIAGWAMALLARGPQDAAIKFLRGLVKKNKLEVASQMRLDELLCQLDSKKWSGSNERKEMLARWLDAKADYILFREGCLRLRDARGGDLDTKLFVEVVGASVAQADQMSEAKVIRLGDLLRFSGLWFGEADKKTGREFLEKMKNVSKSESLNRDIIDGLKAIP
jgi:hypothetical protein